MQKKHRDINKIGVFLFLLLMLHAAYAHDVVDDEGHVLKLLKPANHIVSLSPDLTEILFAVGAGNNIVGVMQGSDYPATAKQLPIVANYMSINVETILSLHPDLIVVWKDVPFLQQLKQLHVPIYVSHPVVVEDIPKTMRHLGRLTGNQAVADTQANQFLKKYHAIKMRYQSQTKIRVFYQVWSKPLLTVTQRSWLNDVINLCGGKNIFANLRGISPAVSEEAVVLSDPDVILGADTDVWKRFSTMTAVERKHIIAMDTSLIERAGPRILVGAEQLCRVIDEVRNEVVRK